MDLGRKIRVSADDHERGCEKLAYADLFSALEPATSRLGRTVNPTVYTQKRLREGNAFVKRVLG